jgi:hypothetical protein
MEKSGIQKSCYLLLLDEFIAKISTFGFNRATVRNDCRPLGLKFILKVEMAFSTLSRLSEFIIKIP